MRRLGIVAVGLALVVATLVIHSNSVVRAQPVASIAMPPPRGAIQLYDGCNNVALSFPDGTDSQTVVNAVTPAGVVDAMWRHNAAQNRFEGFSPAASQASDLLTVNEWDAVWLCLEAAPSNTVWLCRPGLADNPCESDLTTAVVSADETGTIEAAAPAADPPIDCFYVYPTVSGQATENANLQIDPEETAIAIQQAARFSQVCKVYAPMYRQLTVKAILTPGGDKTAARDLAYGDVVSAWQDYLAHYNNGRGVVLIGHSQGAGMLTRLIASEVETDPATLRLLVSALLIGGNVTVPVGQDVGGDFQNVSACRSADQTGCVVAYSSFNQPPPPDSFFGRVGTGPRGGEQASGNLEVLCVNPASLPGGTGALQAYFPTTSVGAWPVGRTPTTLGATPWVAYPGLYTAHCESSGGANWLQIDTTNIPGDQRPVVSQVLGPTWGLHLADVNLALGNLVDLVRQQSAAFAHE
jgi:hypothetical protein